MKAFNPEKELNKIQKGNKNKIILFVISLLVVGVIGYSFALYQIRYSKRIIYTKVADFSRDLNLAVYLDGKKQTEFPDKGDDIIYTNIDCTDDKVTASWDYNDWSLVIESKLPNKCNVYFETRWKDNSGASYPELYQGLIPVYYDDSGNIHIADLSSEWYDYDEHKWANAVLVTNEAYKRIVKEDGSFNTSETISLENDILQMYVWIPRYRYKLWNAISGETSNPQMIEIEFEDNTKSRSLGQTNGEWLTHPAFLFGDTELNGIWVGKFEPSDAQDEIGRNSEIGEITILPDKTSMVSKTIKTMFDASRNIETDSKYNLNSSEVDTHVMKNIDWGAVAYLTSSIYGRYISVDKCTEGECEIWINNTVQGIQGKNGGTYTGCVGASVDAEVIWNDEENTPAKCNTNNVWNKNGIKASTTRNTYGIYDMAGGAWDYVMGVTQDQTGADIGYSDSGFDASNMPDKKYYDLYKYGDKNTLHERGHLGDATRETLSEFGQNPGGWYGDYSNFPNSKSTWFLRGYAYSFTTKAGIFAFGLRNGESANFHSFRVVLTAQDGDL